MLNLKTGLDDKNDVVLTYDIPDAKLRGICWMEEWSREALEIYNILKDHADWYSVEYIMKAITLLCPPADKGRSIKQTVSEVWRRREEHDQFYGRVGKPHERKPAFRPCIEEYNWDLRCGSKYPITILDAHGVPRIHWIEWSELFQMSLMLIRDITV